MNIPVQFEFHLDNAAQESDFSTKFQGGASPRLSGQNDTEQMCY